MKENNINYEKVIIGMVVENYRFINLFNKVISKLDINEQTKYSNQLNYLKNYINNCLEEVGLKIINLENQKYDPGIQAFVINMDDFTNTDKQLSIVQVLEPLIINHDGIVKNVATVLLGDE